MCLPITKILTCFINRWFFADSVCLDRLGRGECLDGIVLVGALLPCIDRMGPCRDVDRACCIRYCRSGGSLLVGLL